MFENTVLDEFDFNLLTYVLLFIILNIVSILVQKSAEMGIIHLDFHNKKKKWIQVVRKSRVVRLQFNKYEQLSFFKRANSFRYFYAGMLVPYILFGLTLFSIYCFMSSNSESTSNMIVAVMAVSTLISICIVFFYLNQTNKKYKQFQSLMQYSEEDFITIRNQLTFSTFYTLFIVILFSLFWFLSYYVIEVMESSVTKDIIVSMYLLSFSLLIIVILMMRNLKSSLQFHAKYLLNNEGFADYPLISIISKSGNSKCGKITDIFDDEYLKLDESGSRIIIPWDSIEILEFIK